MKIHKILSASKLTFILISGGFLLSSCTNSRPDLVWTEDGHQFGKASWYDDHGDRTANGEIFNMYALTAAHPSLALNTIVEVTNLGNGKKITLRVNDRLPPIHEGRVIDLSKAAFRQLDNLNVGLLDVEVRVIKYGNNKYEKINASAPSGKMYLRPKKDTTLAKQTTTTKSSPSKTSTTPTAPVATATVKLPE